LQDRSNCSTQTSTACPQMFALELSIMSPELADRYCLGKQPSTKDKNGMLHSMFERVGNAPFTINLPADSVEEPRIVTSRCSCSVRRVSRHS